MKQNIDWPHHNKQYESSGLTIKEYCSANSLPLSNFQRRRYLMNKSKNPAAPSFKKFDVGATLSISVQENGLVSINSLDPRHLPEIIRAISAL